MNKKENLTDSTSKIWSEEYLLDITEIDAQHEKFVNILTELCEAMNMGKAEIILGDIFEKLREYIKYHFATEEKYFDEFNYSGKEEHKKEHEKFRQKIDSLSKEIEKDKAKISFSLIDFLEDWLVEHVNALDKQYVKCFKDNGLK